MRREGVDVPKYAYMEQAYLEGELLVMDVRDDARHLIVDVEGGANGLISFNAAAFEKWANSSMKNSPEEQQRMLKNFMAALEFQGLKGLP